MAEIKRHLVITTAIEPTDHQVEKQNIGKPFYIDRFSRYIGIVFVVAVVRKGAADIHLVAAHIERVCGCVLETLCYQAID